jgi:low affinity Fe/Cu permease
MSLNQILTLVVAGAVPIMLFVVAYLIQGFNKRTDTFARTMNSIETKVDRTSSKVDNLSGQLTEHLRAHNGRG